MRHARSYARENTIKGLYESRYNTTSVRFEKIKDNLALTIINDIIDNEDTINGYIKKHLKKWTISELNPVVLATIQVGVYEILKGKVDIRIIISDCLSIGNEYLDKKEVKFVHFVLDNVAKDISGN